MTLWIENLQRLVALVDEKLAEAKTEEGEFDSKNYDAWRKRVDAAMRKVMAFFTSEEDASFTSRSGYDCAVKMAGIRSTSTSGWTGALRNWKTAAQKKIAAAGGDVINLQGSGPAPIEPRTR